jgi:hypothetical protein
MLAGNKKVSLILLAISIVLFAPGCNVFEAIDQGVNDTGRDSLVARGNIALDEGRYADALELFERASVKGVCDDTRRGRASSLAGLTGFNMFNSLNSMQNGLVPGDSPAVFFVAASSIDGLEQLQAAISQLWQLNNPGKQDLQLRALLVVFYNCLMLKEKYDTNFNGRLDANDKIDFDTRDDKMVGWQELYANSTSLSHYYSLECAFSDLVNAFEGRGEPWVMISPVAGNRTEGLFTFANRQTVLALANLTDSLETANSYFDNSRELFKQTIIALDGADL